MTEKLDPNWQPIGSLLGNILKNVADRGGFNAAHNGRISNGSTLAKGKQELGTDSAGNRFNGRESARRARQAMG